MNWYLFDYFLFPIPKSKANPFTNDWLFAISKFPI